MDTRVLILLVVVVVVAIVVAAIVIRRRKSEHLKQHFGPEYERAVKLHGDVRHAETILVEREKRVEKLPLRPLSAQDSERYAEEWAVVQRLFVDDPSAAVTQADRLITTVMAARGYPMGDFERRAADLSVHYPTVVQNYRAAREITVRHANGKSSTEDLRRAMVYFRSLFDELIEPPISQRVGVSHERLAS